MAQLLFPVDSWERVRTKCLLILTALALGVALSYLRAGVVPFLVAVGIYFLLAPLSDWIAQRARLPQSAAVGLSLLLGLVVVLGVSYLAVSCIREITREADTYAAGLARLKEDPWLTKISDFAGMERDPETGRLVLITPAQGRQFAAFTILWFKGFLIDAAFVLIFLLFLLLGRPARPSPDGTMVKVAERVRSYLLQMFILSAVTGSMVGIILYLLGVNFSLSFGFLAFILNFLPTLGSIIATLLPLPVILLDDTLTPLAQTMAIVLPAMVQFIIGNVIQPRIQGQAQGLHPVAVLLALIVFGTMWGTAGALLAVPLTSALKIAFERIPGAEPFARLLGGQLT